MSDTELLDIGKSEPFWIGEDKYGREVIYYSLRRLIGYGYDEFWWFDGRYVCCKGSRNSKKSWTTAYWIILHMMEMQYANTLVVRKVGDNNRDSTYALLCKVIYRLHVEHRWRMTTSPLEITYLPTGQKILFRGADNPQKISSITVTHGVLCWAWVEEAYQLDKETDFDLIDQSIRGQMPKGYYPHIFLTFNPWHREHWLKSKFFDVERDDTLAITTDYRCNEFISERDLQYFENLKVQNPRMYQVAGLGDWGVSEGLIYTDWEERDFDKGEIAKRESVVSLFGLDFGFASDPCALVCALLDKATRTIYVYDEWYAKGQSNFDIAERIKEIGYSKERIVCDSAEPKSIYELQKLGIFRATYAIKGNDSIEYGIRTLQAYHFVVSPRCVNFIMELGLYCYDQDAHGRMLNKPIDDFNHGMDAIRYAVMELLYRSGKAEGVVIGPSTDLSSESYREKYGLGGYEPEEDNKYVF